MRTVLETNGDGRWTVREYDDSGKLVQDIGSVIPVSELCRRLKKSRRQVYRYIKQGSLVPAGKYLGEWLVQERGVGYLAGAAQQPCMPIPGTARFLFPEYTLERLHPILDASVIVPRIMEMGDRCAVAWMLRQYPKKWLVRWMQDEGWQLTPRAARFWSWWLGSPLPGPRRIPGLS